MGDRYREPDLETVASAIRDLDSMDLAGSIAAAIDRQTEAIDRQTNMHRQLTLALLGKATALAITWLDAQGKMKALPPVWLSQTMQQLNDGLQHLRDHLMATDPPSTD